jgi:RimJ/RimL family protein N-acetyltransferase
VGVVNKKNNTLIGMMSLYNINYFDRVCDISSIFNKDSKNMNSLIFFKEAQSLLINHAFYKLNLRRISAASNDEKLLKVNKLLFGFTHEGTIKERDYIDGKYVDRYNLGLLKAKWEKFLKK